MFILSKSANVKVNFFLIQTQTLPLIMKNMIYWLLEELLIGFFLLDLEAGSLICNVYLLFFQFLMLLTPSY